MDLEVSTAINRSTASKIYDDWVEILIHHDVMGLKVPVQDRPVV
jgi:hypothetical protein